MNRTPPVSDEAAVRRVKHLVVRDDGDNLGVVSREQLEDLLG